MRQRTLTLRICFLLLCVWPSILAAQLGPTFHDIGVNYKYAGTYRSIREVDFKKLAVYYFEEGGNLRTRLTDGSLQGGGEESVRLDSVHPLKASGGDQYALAIYEWDEAAGSSSQNGIAQLFDLSGGALRVVQQIDWDLHYGGPYKGFSKLFDDKTMTLTFPSARYLDGDAHCCVSAIDIVEMRWSGSRFILAAKRTELSDYGRREGKRLPQ